MINKNFKGENLSKVLKKINEKTVSNYGKDISITSNLLDELYSLCLHCLKEKDNAMLLECAETIKLAYGMAYTQKKIRDNENEYWHRLITISIDAKAFQACEYFVEGAKNLLRLMPQKQVKIIDDLKVTAIMASKERKLFICASVFDILLYWVPKFDKLKKDSVAKIIDCIGTIGVETLKNNDKAFFREIILLLNENIHLIDESEESLWDSIFSIWFNNLLKHGELDSIYDYFDLLSCYKDKRKKYNTDFYAELINSLTSYVDIIDENKFKLIFVKISTYSYYSSNEEFIKTIKASENLFKAFVINADIDKSIVFLKYLFNMLVKMKVRIEITDDRFSIRRIAFREIVALIVDAAIIMSKSLYGMNELQVLIFWRESYLNSVKTDKVKNNIFLIWQSMLEYWAKIRPSKVDEYEIYIKRLNTRL